MKICIKCFNIFECFGICMIWYIQCFLKITHEAPSRVFSFIHVPLFIKILLNCKYYKNFPFFTMHAIKNKKIRFRPPIFQTIINNDFKKHKKHNFSAL